MFQIKKAIVRLQMFFKMVYLKIPQISQKNSVLVSLLNKVTWLNFIKKRLQHRSFPAKFAKFLRAPFPTEHLPGLLLKSKRFL